MKYRKNLVLALTAVLCLQTFVAAQRILEVSGVVTDKDSRRPIAGAAVVAVGNRAKEVAITDDTGSFVLHLSEGVEQGSSVRVRVNKKGYQQYDRLIAVSPEIPLQIELSLPSRSSEHEVQERLLNPLRGRSFQKTLNR